MSKGRSPVLLTGATGFVGSHLWGPLVKAGNPVRCLTRRPDEAARRWPEREWVPGDIGDQDALERALEGCAAAFYLVHGMASGKRDFRRAEVDSAKRFADAAAKAGVGKVVYLGGIEPAEDPSEHLQSRIEVGRILRHAQVPAIELRASMIVGYGSLSWLIVRDLAARLPVMILPRWLRSRTEPLGIKDVMVALLAALDLRTRESLCFDLPGPAAYTGREILERTARLLSRPPPKLFEVPVLTPWLSSQWVRLVTRADWKVARQVVVGLKHDLLARDDRYWNLIGHAKRQSFDDAAIAAIAAERNAGAIPGRWGDLERWLDERVHRFGSG